MRSCAMVLSAVMAFAGLMAIAAPVTYMNMDAESRMRADAMAERQDAVFDRIHQPSTAVTVRMDDATDRAMRGEMDPESGAMLAAIVAFAFIFAWLMWKVMTTKRKLTGE